MHSKIYGGEKNEMMPFVFNIGNDEIEVGDKKADHFRPHAKIRRWGSECFLDIEFPTSERKDPIEEDGKVKWKDEDKEIHFYTIVNKQKTIEEELSESYTLGGECNQCGACCEFYQGGKTCYLGDGVCRNYEKRPDRCGKERNANKVIGCIRCRH
jgi:hypothetical protein